MKEDIQPGNIYRWSQKIIFLDSVLRQVRNKLTILIYFKISWKKDVQPGNIYLLSQKIVFLDSILQEGSNKIT